MLLEMANALKGRLSQQRLSRLICHHQSEWGVDYEALKSEVEVLLDEGINKEEDEEKQQKLTEKKNKTLASLETKVKSFNFWDKVKEPGGAVAPVAPPPPGQTSLSARIANMDSPIMGNLYPSMQQPVSTSESTAITYEPAYVPMPKHPKFWHFHPMAFVEQMRRILKRDIDLRDQEKWQTQFDSKFGDKSKQDVACWRACKVTLSNHNVYGGDLVNGVALYQIAKELNNKLVIDQEIAKMAIEYIDEQIEQGKPILVGVDHTYKYKGGFNNDLTTDHFIVIAGRIYDGNYYYLFYEVGTSYGKHGVSDNNRLYLQSNYSLKGSTSYTTKHSYTVTQVRKNN